MCKIKSFCMSHLIHLILSLCIVWIVSQLNPSPLCCFPKRNLKRASYFYASPTEKIHKNFQCWTRKGFYRKYSLYYLGDSKLLYNNFWWMKKRSRQRSSEVFNVFIMTWLILDHGRSKTVFKKQMDFMFKQKNSSCCGIIVIFQMTGLDPGELDY